MSRRTVVLLVLLLLVLGSGGYLAWNHYLRAATLTPDERRLVREVLYTLGYATDLSGRTQPSAEFIRLFQGAYNTENARRATPFMPRSLPVTGVLTRDTYNGLLAYARAGIRIRALPSGN